MGKGKFYGTGEFNPKLILTQMCVLQSAFYICFVIFNQIWNTLHGMPPALSPLFRTDVYTFSNPRGAGIILSLWMTAVTMSFLMPPVVERLKKCADFVTTCHIMHLLITLLFYGFPMSGYWWMSHIVAATGATLLGEYLCLRNETRSITLSEPKCSPAGYLV
eukprot:GEMP01080146.1.p1 GENE.GEMP01080146.1~~GEMP01080146.1.p1  ORF type:complete len:162 (+),score=5.16 GEMP01080146.1:159-644(+)